TGGVENVQPLLKKKVKELDNTELNIAVTGDTGAGKSTLIDAMRGLRKQDEGAAAVGTTETTMEPTVYPHPTLPNIRYWDLPGIGSTRFTAGSYLKEMQFKKYDFFIIVSAGRFRENDANLAKEIKRLGKEFYFVRSKIDADLYSMREEGGEFDEEAEMGKIRSDCVSKLGMAGIPNPTVFLISIFGNDKYDFPRLMEALECDLPRIKESVFVLAHPNDSAEIIRKKGEVLKERIWMLTFLAWGVGVIPVPVLSGTCNIGIMIGAIPCFREYLCLDDAALRRLADRTGTSVEALKAEAGSPSLGEIISKVIVSQYLGVPLIVKVIGLIFGPGLSFLMVFMTLSDVLKLLMETAEKKLAVAKGAE
ncbi:interferon-inducible GTPase 1-like, partial [Amblyraja radiata]|uniref:interferon-inducible GTPase 1-like n=1 Tax=Amblyraja radiata TaxID=386614 RepID=UPI0014021628